MKPPIIFIHYGDSHYLRYVFELAYKFNHDTDIILLGDASNKKYEQLGIKHLNFDDFTSHRKIERFKTNFKYICGDKFVGGEKWTRFNFYKMFVLEQVTKQLEIESFWIFDSDVLITERLSDHVYKFKNFDFSYHNELFMPQGMINSRGFIDDFNEFLINSFSDRHFLEQAKIEIDLKNKPQNGLTYMYFFKKYVETHDLSLINYQTIINGETFNPVLFFSHGMELYPHQPFRYPMKKLFFYPEGEVFTRTLEGEFAKLVTINTSWVEPFILSRIYNQAKKYNAAKKTGYNLSKLKVMHLNESDWILWKKRLKTLKRKLIDKAKI